MNVTLRSGIKFQDGETLNSSAVYFSYNRELVFDGSSPVSHGTQSSWLLQQLENKSLSTTLSGPQNYSQKWVGEVLGQNFVQITGPLTLTLHTQNPTSALAYILGQVWGEIVAPDYVMQQDLRLWSQSTNGYTLPYPIISDTGNITSAFEQYFDDFIATCNAGATPNGCAATYLDGSQQGGLAGTGPYIISSVNLATNDLTFTANPNYWGGPFGTIHPHIQTIEFNFVPNQNTRILDLENAAQSGKAMGIDLTADSIYDVANRTAWLNYNNLVSTIPGVSIYGLFSEYNIQFDIFATNVTNPLTGQFYSFQPFADLRMRLAMADAVNLSEIDIAVDNKLGAVAPNAIPPGFPPAGSYNTSDVPRYSFNPDQAQNLLLQAMMHPITNFTFENGTIAKPGFFNNTFGCQTLNSNGQCSNPVPQTIQLIYGSGSTVDEAIYNQIAIVINNISSTYNMGLTVEVTPLPAGQMITEALSGQVYSWAESPYGWGDDYPWVMDFLGVMYAPGGVYTGPGGWNLTAMENYWKQAQADNSDFNITGLVSEANQMVELGNQAVMNLWTFYPEVYSVLTSNIQGYVYNPSLNPGNGIPEFWAYLS